MTMRRLVLRRVPQTLLVALGVGLVAFGITRLLPGDPASTWAGPRASREELALVREQLGLDLPLPEQVARYLLGLVQGDWGISIHTRQPVIDDVLGRLVASLELVGVAMLIAVVAGLLLGMAGARWKGRWPDWISSALTAVLVSAPIFWLALLLQLTVATELELLPVAGRYDREFRDAVAADSVTGIIMLDALLRLNGPLFLSSLTHVLLPALVVAAYPTGLIGRLSRASLIETLGEEHIRMARAIGYPERTILFRFALRPSMGPVLAALALVFGYALANTFLVENIFNWPGLGSYVADSISTLDAPSIAGATVVVALAYLLANLVVDLVRPIVDPRLR
ncbi:MAG: ABC transporter permease [Candidatus Limnocylindrales bacterium]|jgi:peptide/nickel transport system permease protein